MRKGFIWGVVTAALVAALAPAAASAGTIQVNTLADQNNTGAECALREAAQAATDNAAFGGCTGATAGSDDITFLPSLTAPAGQQVIDLTASTQVNLGSDVQLIGPGAGELAVDGPPLGRVFSSNGTSGISGLTITNGNLTGTDFPGDLFSGAGIDNFGTLTLDGVAVVDNEIHYTNAAGTATAVAEGAGINNADTLTVLNSVIADNTAEATNTVNDTGTARASGAGILGGPGSTTTIRNSVIDENHAIAEDTQDALSAPPEARGGGLRLGGATVFIDRTSITRNTTSVLSVDNNGGAVGGGVSTGAAGVALELVTVVDNTTTTDGVHRAGGLDVDAGDVNVASSTIARNGPEPATAVNGANVRRGSADIFVGNTIIAEPRGGGDNCGGNPPAAALSSGFNLEHPVGVTACYTPVAGDVTGNPMLAAGLGLNGATTETLALLPGSAALDVGTNLLQQPALLNQDQRGLTRPADFSGLANGAGNGSDIGAFELQLDQPCQPLPGAACPQPPPVIQTPPATAPGPTGERAAALKKCKKKPKKKRKKCRKKARKLPV